MNVFKRIKNISIQAIYSPSFKPLTKTDMDFWRKNNNNKIKKKKALPHRRIHVLSIWLNKK